MKLIFFTTASLFLSLHLSAQSIYRANSGAEYARKVSENRYESLPTGAISYLIEENTYWSLAWGEKKDDREIGHIRESADTIFYYDEERNMQGYCVLAEKRFYRTVAEKDTILKEFHLAVLFNGALYTGDENNDPRFRIDDDFPLDWLGFFLIIF